MYAQRSVIDGAVNDNDDDVHCGNKRQKRKPKINLQERHCKVHAGIKAMMCLRIAIERLRAHGSCGGLGAGSRRARADSENSIVDEMIHFFYSTYFLLLRVLFCFATRGKKKGP